jgi:hypothetical protein
MFTFMAEKDLTEHGAEGYRGVVGGARNFVPDGRATPAAQLRAAALHYS